MNIENIIAELRAMPEEKEWFEFKENLNKRGLENNTSYFVALRGFDENGEPIRGPKKKIESASYKRKREKQLQQLQQSKEFIDKVTRHDRKSETENLKSDKDKK